MTVNLQTIARRLPNDILRKIERILTRDQSTVMKFKKELDTIAKESDRMKRSMLLETLVRKLVKAPLLSSTGKESLRRAIAHVDRKREEQIEQIYKIRRTQVRRTKASERGTLKAPIGSGVSLGAGGPLKETPSQSKQKAKEYVIQTFPWGMTVAWVRGFLRREGARKKTGSNRVTGGQRHLDNMVNSMARRSTRT